MLHLKQQSNLYPQLRQQRFKGQRQHQLLLLSQRLQRHLQRQLQEVQSNMRIWDKRIPTLAAVILIAVGVIATSFLVESGVIYLGGAAPSDAPQDVKITNITDQALTITYKTDTAVIGTVSLGQTKDNLQTALDDRDQISGVPKEYVVHSISMKNLKPNTSYVFSITSGATTYLNNNELFQIKTGPEISVPPSSQPAISGKIVNASGSAPAEALVYLTTSNGQLLSTLTKTDGSYILPLNTYRTASLASLFAFTPNTTLQLLTTDGVTIAHATFSSSLQGVIPLVSLGNDYNFISNLSTPLSSESAAIGFPSFSSGSNFLLTPVITVPKKDQGFSDAQPQFSGKALPNQQVTIEIHSTDVVEGSVKADASGNWTYRPTTPLSPGQHIISVTTAGANGILQTIQQSFTVYAAGSQVDQTATPSATTATPTQKPTPTSSAASASPTIKPTPTSIPVLQTTLTPTPISKLPPTGNNSLVVATITGIATSTIGIVLFLLTRGAAL